MDNINIARKIVLGAINNTGLDLEEKVAEITLVTTNNERLLEHMNSIIEVFEDAKKEIENKED